MTIVTAAGRTCSQWKPAMSSGARWATVAGVPSAGRGPAAVPVDRGGQLLLHPGLRAGGGLGQARGGELDLGGDLGRRERGLGQRQPQQVQRVGEVHSGEFQRDGRAGPAGVSLPGDAGGGGLQLEPAGGDPLRARGQGRGHDSGDALAALRLGIGRDAQVADHGGHMLAGQVMQEEQ